MECSGEVKYFALTQNHIFYFIFILDSLLPIIHTSLSNNCGLVQIQEIWQNHSWQVWQSNKQINCKIKCFFFVWNALSYCFEKASFW